MINNKNIFNSSNSNNIKTAIKYGIDNSNTISGTEWSMLFNRPDELNNINNLDSLILFIKWRVGSSSYSYMAWCQLDYKTYKNQTYWLDFGRMVGFLLKIDENCNILAKYTDYEGNSAGNYNLSGSVTHETNSCLAFYYFL